MTNYSSLSSLFRRSAELIRAPDRYSVSEAAAKYRYVYQPGAYIGWWKNSETPYMVEPMDMFTNRKKKAIIAMMSAQTGKTDSLIVNTTLYTVVVDPIDMIIYNPSQGLARDFSMRRIDRLHTHSKAVGAQLLPTKDADNVFDKHYRNGTILTLSHPSVAEFRGRPIGRVVLTDYDGMPMDVGGEGSPFDLAIKRTQTFGTLGICVAESTPAQEIKDPRWIAKTPHESPPAEGISDLYNLGDRRLWFWPCWHCNEYFQGDFHLLGWDHDEKSNSAKARSAYMACPHCGSMIQIADRHKMQQWGMWVPEGQWIDSKGHLKGDEPDNPFVSYWLKGTAAAFTTWEDLVYSYLNAEDTYKRSMSEEPLKKFWNTDMGVPYLPKSMSQLKSPEEIKSRAISLPERKVTSDVRFLIGTVDVQKDRFVVEVWGIRPGKPFDMVLIDRFEIIYSERLDDQGNPLPLDPAAYVSDWHQIRKQVIEKKYPLEDDSGTMAVKLTLCDSGGRAGVTTNAYNFYRELAAPEFNLTGRFLLVKGRKLPNQPRVVLSYPDSSRKDRTAGARGEIPVLLINSDMIKDTLDARLKTDVPGQGMVVHPDWLSIEYYQELCVEVRTNKGWENPNKEKNEAWDLGCYCIAGCLSQYIAIERIDAGDWNKVPVWAEKWDSNIYVEMHTEQGVKRAERQRFDFTKLGNSLA